MQRFKFFFALSIFCLLFTFKGNAQEQLNIKVMTYNVLYSTPDDGTLKVLKSSEADIIGLQEVSKPRLAFLANKLGYYFYSFGETLSNGSKDDTGILSRYPISRTFDNGVVIHVNQQTPVAIFNVHLSAYPYEPYDVRDGDLTTAKGVIASARNTRLEEIRPALREIKESVENWDIPVFLTGDFNEPSHLDWTEKAAAADMHFSIAVEWPVSKAITAAGFEDAYRTVFPDEVENPGYTWTPIDSEDEVHDRIDIVYYKGEEITVKDARIIGPADSITDLSVNGYPSDHRAVVAEFEIENKKE